MPLYKQICRKIIHKINLNNDFKFKELQFQVFAFTNLTLRQMRNAVELFASFIDEETYCLFYYNGHAVGHSEDIYLAPVESSLDEHDPTPLSQVF